MPKVSILRYYAVRKGYNSGIYLNWKDCEKQVKGCSGALYKKFETKQQAQKYIDEQKIEGDNLLNIWTDVYCKKNIKTDTIAIIRALEICDKKLDIVINTDSLYIINSKGVKKPKVNFDLVNWLNDLIKEHEGKTYFKHVKGHLGIFENEEADHLAYLGSKKPFVKLCLPEVVKNNSSNVRFAVEHIYST
ncbi:7965_t:CDS:2, partial [Dentiscutata heterogama]